MLFFLFLSLHWSHSIDLTYCSYPFICLCILSLANWRLFQLALNQGLVLALKREKETPARECQWPPELKSQGNGFLQKTFSCSLLSPWLQPNMTHFGILTSRTVRYCVILSHCVCGSLLQEPYETNVICTSFLSPYVLCLLSEFLENWGLSALSTAVICLENKPYICFLPIPV